MKYMMNSTPKQKLKVRLLYNLAFYLERWAYKLRKKALNEMKDFTFVEEDIK